MRADQTVASSRRMFSRSVVHGGHFAFRLVACRQVSKSIRENFIRRSFPSGATVFPSFTRKERGKKEFHSTPPPTPPPRGGRDSGNGNFYRTRVRRCVG